MKDESYQGGSENESEEPEKNENISQEETEQIITTTKKVSFADMVIESNENLERIRR